MSDGKWESCEAAAVDYCMCRMGGKSQGQQFGDVILGGKQDYSHGWSWDPELLWEGDLFDGLT